MLTISGKSADVIKNFSSEAVKQKLEKTFSPALKQVANANDKTTLRHSAPAVFRVKAQIAPPSLRLQQLIDNHNARRCMRTANRLSPAENAGVREKNTIPTDDRKSIKTVALTDNTLDESRSRLKDYPKLESPSLVKNTLVANGRKNQSDDHNSQSTTCRLEQEISQCRPELKSKNYAEAKRKYNDFINVATRTLVLLEKVAKENELELQDAGKDNKGEDCINKLRSENNKELFILADKLVDNMNKYSENLKKVEFRNEFFPAQDKPKVKALRDTTKVFIKRILSGIENLQLRPQHQQSAGTAAY
ncbi:hypothetical protein [Kalamiella sp. sgz302252]|uniref:hypothetical protein n=1 Tax=Pantoea sp. sgz302252 TaxID=3341827 RepID=UPI0036D27C91